MPRQLSRRGLAPSGALAKVRHPVPDWMRAHEACFVRSHVPWDGLVLARAKSREQSPATATADGQSPLGASWAPFDAAEDPPWANPTPHQDFISSTTPYSHGSCLILRVPGTLGRSQILGKLPVAACPPQRQKPVPLSRLDATVTVAPTGGLPSSQKGVLIVLLGPAASASDRNASATMLGCMSRRQGWPQGFPRGKSVKYKARRAAVFDDVQTVQV